MSKRLTNEEFINRCQRAYGEKYEYLKVKYESAHKKVTITCPIHGDFETKPANFLSGKGCRKCGRIDTAAKLLKDKDHFLQKAKAAHGDRYDYSKLEYQGLQQKGVIICPVHGEFSQILNNHVKGGGCKKCGRQTRSAKRTLPLSEVIDRFVQIHGGRYDYSRVNYKGVFEKVEIICAEHGSFYQTPDRHMAGSGCSKCGSSGPSTPELELLDFIRTLDPDAEGSNRTVIAPLELDIVSHSHKIAVEFHGLYFHSDKFRQSTYHLDKLKKCNSEGYDLIQVFEDEWTDPVKKDIVRSIISARFGRFNRRIPARKTVRRPVTSVEARKFFNANHIQGFTAATLYDGLFYEGELVAAMILTSPRAAITRSKNIADLELVRFVTLVGTQVVGGFTKLLSAYKNKSIVTYCDRRIFNAKGYEVCGFLKVRENAPEYYYVKGPNRFSRHGFFKKSLGKKLKNFNPDATEKQNMADNGYHRIYGCGTITFIRKPENQTE